MRRNRVRPTGLLLLMWEKIALIFIGWLFGLLGPTIIDVIKKQGQKREIQAGIKSELIGIQYLLASAVYSINNRFGTLDKNLLSWALHIFKKYDGVYADSRLLEAIKSQLTLNEEQLAALGKTMKSGESRALILRKHATPFLDYHIGNLSMFPLSFQSPVLEIKAQLRLLNDRIEDSYLYFRMTFEPNIGSNNYDAVRQNIEDCYKSIAEKSRTIAVFIDKKIIT